MTENNPTPAPEGSTFTPEQFQEFVSNVQSGIAGEDFEASCSIQPLDHVHVTRLSSGVTARVGLGLHDRSDAISVYLTPAVARQVAAALLNAADEIDGVTPLTFVQ